MQLSDHDPENFQLHQIVICKIVIQIADVVLMDWQCKWEWEWFVVKTWTKSKTATTHDSQIVWLHIMYVLSDDQKINMNAYFLSYKYNYSRIKKSSNTNTYTWPNIFVRWNECIITMNGQPTGNPRDFPGFRHCCEPIY